MALSLCPLVSQLETVITATSLSTVSAAFDAGSVASWVPSAYLLTSTSFSPLYGRFSDILGRKASLTVWCFWFTIMIILSGLLIWSIACGLSSTVMAHTRQSVMAVFMLLSRVGSGQMLQTTTVAAQASVPRKDMAVVTAFRNVFLAALVAIALAQTPDGPTTKCFRPNDPAESLDCRGFIDEFCNNVAKPTILQKEWVGQCIGDAPGQTESCHFYAYNTRDDNNSPSIPYCKNVLNAIIDDCPGGGWGRAGSETAAYTFILDPDYTSCGDGILADHHP
ncbi:hypothetical protein AN958_09307 [Leucoagaricus sp. SymC.cos]|nr:hypothetical protein AN958_09307 [Leucoagaricus sp. SymC.cos]